MRDNTVKLCKQLTNLAQIISRTKCDRDKLISPAEKKANWI